MIKKELHYIFFVILIFGGFLFSNAYDFSKIKKVESALKTTISPIKIVHKGKQKGNVRFGWGIDYDEFELLFKIKGKRVFSGVNVLGTPLYSKIKFFSRGRAVIKIFVEQKKKAEFIISAEDGFRKEKEVKFLIDSSAKEKEYRVVIHVKNEGFYPKRTFFWPPRNTPLKEYGTYSGISSANFFYEKAEKTYNEVLNWLNSMKVSKIILNPELVRKTFTGKPYKIKDKRRINKKRIDKLNKILYLALKEFSLKALFDGNESLLLKSIKNSYKKALPLRNYAKKFKVYLIGNAHIDIAWLWRIGETKYVARNTYKTVLKNMKEYPELIYAQSQAITYEWMEKEFPEVFEEIKKRVKEGRWEIVGGMWVEPDCNLISGESWVRQILYGKKYFKEKFGIDVKLGWNPDSFGYNWNMPQIYKKSGINYFVTQKIWWNDTTVFPYYVFYWRGVDGTKLLTYFPPVGYATTVKLFEIVKAISTYEAVTGEKETLVLYGLGDHGGGPNREILNRIRSYKKLFIAPQFIHSRAEDFIKRIPERFKEIPVWNDELYLEYHRGTYTTQAKIKKNNRYSESLINTQEKLSSIAYILGKSYPTEKLNESWKKILTNQFHDILPGSGITPIYRDALSYYREAQNTLKKIEKESLNYIEKLIDTSGSGIPVLVFNTSSFKRSDVVSLKMHLKNGNYHVETYNGKEVLSEVEKIDDGLFKVYFFAENIPSIGYKLFFVKKGKSKLKGTLKISGFNVENEFFKISINKKTGNIKSLFYKPLNAELVKDGDEINKLVVYEDRPERWDAWNIGYTGRFWEIKKADSVKLLKSTPLRAVFEIKRSFLGLTKSRYSPTEDYPSSFFTQYVVVYSKIPRIDVFNKFDWWESHMLLKAEFPLRIKSEYAWYEIPFSAIKRTTRFNTLWEKARFEVPALRWADLSDGRVGVSILNDSKYGYDIHNGIIKLSLLRSPEWPDKMADRGKHEFLYSIYPHKGDFEIGDTVKRGIEVNTELIVFSAKKHNGKLPKEMSFFEIDGDSVILDSIKLSEDFDGLILRLYESEGKNSSIKLKFFKKPISIHETDLMENNLRRVVPQKEVDLKFKKFEIRSFRVKFL